MLALTYSILPTLFALFILSHVMLSVFRLTILVCRVLDEWPTS